MLRILSPRICTTFTRTGMLFNVKTLDERKDWLKKRKSYSKWENEMVHEIFAENNVLEQHQFADRLRMTNRLFQGVEKVGTGFKVEIKNTANSRSSTARTYTTQFWFEHTF